MSEIQIISPRSGVAFILKKNQLLRITDIEGEQVADLVCFNLHDQKEYLSSGRTIDYAGKIFLTTDDPFYSNRSNPMFKIVEDNVGRHDFLLTPCSAEMFRKIYGHDNPHRGCFGNLCNVLEPYGIGPDEIPVTFNIFMNVSVNGDTGKIAVLPPLSKAGDSISLLAEMDLIVGLTACSAGMSNNFKFKPIGFQID
jgi:uncharacterized protein YcgI (DUF1989 family)